MKTKTIAGNQLGHIIVPTGHRLLIYSRDKKVYRIHPKTLCALFARFDFEISTENELVNPSKKEDLCAGTITNS